jgi:flagellar hook-length control protein FliK
MLKLLKVNLQSDQAAASMLQLKIQQQMQAQEAAGQAASEEMPQANLPQDQNLAPQETPTKAASLQEEMAAFFSSVRTDGQEAPDPEKEFSSEMGRVLADRALKGETTDEPALNPNLTDKAKDTQPKAMEPVPAKTVIDLTELQKQGAADGKEFFNAVAEKKAPKQKESIAAVKAAPAAVAHASAKSAVVAEQPVDMGASLDQALSQQRPIKKEESIPAEGRLQTNAEPTTAPTATAQNAPASGETLQTVEPRLNSLEARPAQHVKETAETPTASKEMQTDVIHQIVQRMSLRSDGRNSSMQIKLKPEFLGNLHMEVVAENQQVTVRMTAENQVVKGIIEQNLHVLKNELQHHGLQIQKFDVFVSQDNDPWRNGQQQTAFRQAQDRGYRSGSGRGAHFADTEEAELVEGAVGPSRSYGEKSSVDFFA